MARLALVFVPAAWLTMFPCLFAAETAESLRTKSQAALAQVEGELALDGLHEPVQVLRDRYGVAHIYATNQDDLFFAQGVVAAQDRLFQMELWRRAARGEMAAVFGPAFVEADRFARLVKFRGDQQAEWASYSPDARQIIAAFTRGINAYLAQLGDRLPVEFGLLGFRPEPWQPEDCLGRLAGIAMTRNFRSEIDLARLVSAVGVEKAQQLISTDPFKRLEPPAIEELKGIGPALVAGYEAATRPWEFARFLQPAKPPQAGPPAAAGGSNNWVIDSRLSASHKPMLANDPHRAVVLPALRYLVHLNAPGWNVIGAGEPALPGVAVGHNEKIAWGFTIVGSDQSDLYIEQTHPNDPTRYRVGEQWESMQVVKETIRVLGQAEPVELTLRSTRHGPVLGEDRQRQRAYALRWVGSEPGTAGYLASLSVARAENWQQFRAAAARRKLPSENLVYADVEGNIGWIAAAQVPKRTNHDGLLPVDGSDGTHEWQGFLDLDDLPQEFNPAEHFIVTANNNILPPGYLYPISYQWAPSFRHDRLQRRLESGTPLDADDFRDMQHDNTSLPGQALTRLIRPLEFKEPRLREPAALVKRWDGVMAVDSGAAALYAVWWEELASAFFAPHVPKELLAGVAAESAPTVMLAALEKPDKTWFGAHPLVSRERLLRETFSKAVARLEQLLSTDIGTWSWGRLHQLALRHPLSALGPEYAAAFDLAPVPVGGDGYSPNQSRYNEKFQHQHGASYRQIFDLADWDRALATSTPGQSGQPGSPHYADLLPLWQRGEYFPLAFTAERVEELTQHKLILKPSTP